MSERRPKRPVSFYISIAYLSRVPVFVYEAKRKIGMFCMSCRSTMNFVRE
jgi:hypothetical protein